MNGLWDVSKSSDYLGRSDKFVYRHARELGAMKVGSRLMFRKSEIDKYLDRRRLGPRRGR